MAAVRALLIALVLYGCNAAPPPPPAPPTLDVVGLISTVEIHNGFVRYGLADGSNWNFPDGTYRLVGFGGHGGKLLVVGRDSEGQFIATFMTQDGLPTDCYFENATGIERGAYVEMRGILWAKAPGLVSSVPVPPLGWAYPGGTRFCLSDAAQVTATVGR